MSSKLKMSEPVSQMWQLDDTKCTKAWHAQELYFFHGRFPNFHGFCFICTDFDCLFLQAPSVTSGPNVPRGRKRKGARLFFCLPPTRCYCRSTRSLLPIFLSVDKMTKGVFFKNNFKFRKSCLELDTNTFTFPQNIQCTRL
jgi:hypothetical protein